MATLHLLFSHSLTDRQQEDARQTLGVTQFKGLPETLQQQWSNIPPDAAELTPLVQPFQEWLQEQATPGDFALIQGDFGMTYRLVTFALQQGLVPVYATTERTSVEETQPDGSVKVSKVFRHKRYRHYAPDR